MANVKKTPYTTDGGVKYGFMNTGGGEATTIGGRRGVLLRKKGLDIKGLVVETGVLKGHWSLLQSPKRRSQSVDRMRRFMAIGRPLMVVVEARSKSSSNAMKLCEFIIFECGGLLKLSEEYL